MKHPKLRINRKVRITRVKKLKKELHDIVGWCLDDIRYYIVDDLLKYMKKRGILYVKKTKAPKKNRKKKKR